MSLSTIPDLCLLTILDRIPLKNLLSTVNLVCRRWAQLQPVACHRRNCLFLCDNRYYLDYIFENKFARDHDVKSKVIKDDGTPFDGWIYVKYQLGRNGLRLSLQVATQNRSLEHLITLLPNIKKLQLGQSVSRWPTVIHAVNCLLEKWSTKLVNLNLWLYNNSQSSHPHIISNPALIDPLFDRLNQLTSLRRLTIQLYLPYNMYSNSSEHEFTTKLTPVLSRVEQFDYGGYYEDKLFEGHILKDLETVLKGQSFQLKGITLRPIIPTDYVRSRYSSRFTAKLTTFIVCLGYEEWLNDLVISRLSCIETLYVKDDPPVDISFTDFIGKLTHLSRLTFIAFLNFPKCFFKNVNPSQSHQPLPQIRSLKALRITFQIPLSHHYISQLSIPSLFPNVQVIKLHQIVYGHPFIACIDCNYKFADIPSVTGAPLDGQTDAMLERCSRLTLESLNKCNPNQTRVIQLVRYDCPPYDGDIGYVVNATYAPGQI